MRIRFGIPGRGRGRSTALFVLHGIEQLTGFLRAHLPGNTLLPLVTISIAILCGPRRITGGGR